MRQPAQFALANLAHIYGNVGDQKRASQLLDRISQTKQASMHVHRALVHVGLAQADRAVDSMSASWQSRSWNAIFANTDPRFKALESYDPYLKLQDEFETY